MKRRYRKITALLSLFIIAGSWTLGEGSRGSVRFTLQSQNQQAFKTLKPNLDDESANVPNSRFVRRRTTTTSSSLSIETAAKPYVKKINSRFGDGPTESKTSIKNTEIYLEAKVVNRREKQNPAPSLRSDNRAQPDFERRIDDKGRNELKPMKDEVFASKRRVAKSGSFGDQPLSTDASTMLETDPGTKRAKSLTNLSKNSSNDPFIKSESPSHWSILRGKTTKTFRDISAKRDDGSSEENYPEPFKKLLKAQFNDDTLKEVYVQKLESTIQKSMHTLSGRRKNQSTTLEIPHNTQMIVIVNKPDRDSTRRVESAVVENGWQRRTVLPKTIKQTRRNSQHLVTNSTSSDIILQTSKSSELNNAQESSREMMQRLSVRTRYTASSEQSSKEQIDFPVEYSIEGVKEQSSSSNVKTSLKTNKRLLNTAQLDARMNVKVLSTTTSGPTTTVKLITQRPVRSYTRKQNTLAYLTSTTTEPTTTTRKAFLPTPRGGVHRKPTKTPTENDVLSTGTTARLESAPKRSSPISRSNSKNQTENNTVSNTYTQSSNYEPGDESKKMTLLYTNPVEYLRRKSSSTKPIYKSVIENSNSLVRINNGSSTEVQQLSQKTSSTSASKSPALIKRISNNAYKRRPSFSSNRANIKSAVYTPTIPTVTTLPTVKVIAGDQTLQKPANFSTKLPSRIASLSSHSTTTAALANEIDVYDDIDNQSAMKQNHQFDREETEEYIGNDLESRGVQLKVLSNERLPKISVVGVEKTSGGTEKQIVPVSSGLTQSRIDIDTPSHRVQDVPSAVTVSIFSALSEILSQPTGTTTIIEILRKYNEDNQLDAKVKSENVFSLAAGKIKSTNKTPTISNSTDITLMGNSNQEENIREDVRVSRPNAPDIVYRWKPMIASSTLASENEFIPTTSMPKGTAGSATPSVSENTVPDMMGIGKAHVSNEASLTTQGSSNRQRNDFTLKKNTVMNAVHEDPSSFSGLSFSSTSTLPNMDETTLTPIEWTAIPSTVQITKPVTQSSSTIISTISRTTTLPTTTTINYASSISHTTPKLSTTTSMLTSIPFSFTNMPRKPTTTVRPITTQRTRTTTFSDAEDLAFLRQLARFLNGGQSSSNSQRKTTKKTTTTSIKPTTTTASSTTTTTTTTTISTTTPKTTTTTPKPTTTPSLSTVIIDNDDPAFLNDVRKLPNFATPNPLVDTPLANRILQLAIQRDPKSIARLPLKTENEFPSIEKLRTENQSKEISKPTTLSPEEIEKTKKQLNREVQQYNNDLKLLSNLLGRPITEKDIPNLTKQLGTGGSGPLFANTGLSAMRTTTAAPTTIRTTISNKVRRPTSTADAELLKQLLLTQQEQHNSSPAVIESPDFYGKTNEAILAAVLKQRGIGPSNTNGDIEDILAQITPNVQTATLPSKIITTSRTTPRRTRPPQPPPLRSQSPILDGLSWLWREWQATAPQSRNRVPSPGASATNVRSGTFGLSGGGGGLRGRTTSLTQSYGDEGLDPDAKPINPSVTEEPASLFGGFGINPGGQLLNAAIGVTRAVSQFLGVALQGAAKSFTSAFRPQPAAGEPLDDLSYYRSSGR